MTANLLRALAKGTLVLRNLTQTEVMLYYPGTGGVQRHRLFKPLEVVNISAEVPVESLRKSTNLASLVAGSKLRVEQ